MVLEPDTPSGSGTLSDGTVSARLYVFHVLLGRLHVRQYPCQRWARTPGRMLLKLPKSTSSNRSYYSDWRCGVSTHNAACARTYVGLFAGGRETTCATCALGREIERRRRKMLQHSLLHARMGLRWMQQASHRQDRPFLMHSWVRLRPLQTLPCSDAGRSERRV